VTRPQYDCGLYVKQAYVDQLGLTPPTAGGVLFIPQHSKATMGPETHVFSPRIMLATQ